MFTFRIESMTDYLVSQCVTFVGPYQKTMRVFRKDLTIETLHLFL